MAITKSDIKSDISQDKVEVKIDLSKELKGIPSFHKTEITATVAKLLRKEIGNDAVVNARSSVTGKKFPKLSPDYKAHKKKLGKGGNANLVLNGDMLGDFKQTSSVQTIKLEIKKKLEKKKFYNHNVGDTLPKRQALPNEGEAFRKGIMEKVNNAIARGKAKALKELLNGSD